MRRQAIFPAVRISLPDIAELVTDFAREIGMTEECVRELELAVDEASTNIVEHAYPEEIEGKIEIECRLDSEGFAVVLRDDGLPFDQTDRTEAVVEGPLEDRHIGGYGRFLMRQCLDNLFYERVEGWNVLTFIKHIRR